MKARQLLLDQLLEINPRTGIITLNGSRMALMETSALGLLRRDLVATLGMDRAKGFLMRYGYACGQSDAKAVRSMFEWDSPDELFLAGPQLHTVEGIVTVEPLELNVDWESGSMVFTGEWRHSYEADEHLHHFGVSEEPVCWTLVGYASGYLTEIFGHRVLVYEPECRGQGDARCVYTAKSWNLCTDAERLLGRYYEAESLATELDAAYQRISLLNQTWRESVALHRRLSDLMFEGKTLDEIVRVIGDALHRSVFVENQKGRLLSESVMKLDHRNAYRNWKARSGSAAQMGKTISAGKTECWEYDATYVEVLVIGTSTHSFGHLCLIGEEPLAEEELILAERASNICAIQLFQERLIVQEARLHLADFLDEVISGRFDEQTLIRRARLLDIDPEEPRRMMAFRVEPEEELLEVCEYVRQKYPGFEAFPKNGYLIGLYSLSQLRRWGDGVDEFLLSVLNACEKKFKVVRILAGCGRLAESVGNIGYSYDDAVSIVDFLEVLENSGVSLRSRYGVYEQFQTLLLIVKAAPHKELADFYRSVLGRLEEYDRTHQGELLPTLRAYLEHTGNIRKVAGALYVSETGLRYRIRKIEELCQVNLDDGGDRFKIHLALQIHDSLCTRKGSVTRRKTDR
ncbi:XylR N-terminal domain-containing protein [Kyrpidia tusciae]|uniref:Transcriptional regulator, PucR family n=1 Tax=Kyrpidia tusciae (strain DSM 2912 / NBRC 15312 / T2) TaxID=562970 RepID=D5WW71_KYRT2|nr:XylR N-terminal domain-containing protein [Kyrpidia tusciae]ADG05703.1 putative transcriptional regulator, PucR family [Kyrpidia tusciae DSM 2912]